MALLYGIFISLLCMEFVYNETAVMHYGHFGGLRINCGRDELISMDYERLGYSTNTDCNPASTMLCTLHTDKMVLQRYEYM